MSRPQVFLSHSGADKARFVVPLAERLRERGIEVWLDSWTVLPGDSLVDRIFTDGIGAATAVIVVLSRDGAGSNWVREELNAAAARRIDAGCRLIVVRLDDVPIPAPLAGLAWVDVDPRTDWSEQFERIVRAVGAPQPPGPPRLPALRDALRDPARWIAVHDIVKGSTDAVIGRLDDTRFPRRVDPDGGLPALVQRRLAGYDDVTGELAGLLALGGYFGNQEHEQLWVRSIGRVLRTATGPGARADEVWQRLARYPALRLAYAVGIAAVASGDREGLLLPLLQQPAPTPPHREPEPVWRCLAAHRVLDPDLARALPCWTGTRHPLSVHLRQTLRPALADVLDDEEYARAFERYEYLRSLLELHLSGGRLCTLGEFAWSLDNRDTYVDEAVAGEVRAQGEQWPLLRAGAFGGRPEAVLATQEQLRERYC